MTHEIGFTWIGICLPDYLTDHHNRQNEVLLVGSIYDGMTLDDLVYELWDSLNYCACDIFAKFTDSQIKQAIALEVDCYISRDFGLCLSNFGLETRDLEGENSEIFLYGYLIW